MQPAETRKKRSTVAKLLVLYLAFVLYLYLANWLGYLRLVYLPLSTLPTGSLLPLVLLGVVAVTLFNSKRKSRKAPQNKST